MTYLNPNPIAEDVWTSLGVSRESIARLAVLAEVTATWQRHINLISPSTLPHIWNRHILDSAQLLPFLPRGVGSIADLGSGGGFPGLVLAATTQAELHLYEANGKKVAFLKEALRQMKVEAHIHHGRLEPFDRRGGIPQVQVVTSRAFAPLQALLGFAEPFMRGGATGLFHKGQDVDAELTEAAKSWKISVLKHSSLTDSRSVILEVKEASHVDGKH